MRARSLAISGRSGAGGGAFRAATRGLRMPARPARTRPGASLNSPRPASMTTHWPGARTRVAEPSPVSMGTPFSRATHDRWSAGLPRSTATPARAGRCGAASARLWCRMRMVGRPESLPARAASSSRERARATRPTARPGETPMPPEMITRPGRPSTGRRPAGRGTARAWRMYSAPRASMAHSMSWGAPHRLSISRPTAESRARSAADSRGARRSASGTASRTSPPPGAGTSRNSFTAKDCGISSSGAPSRRGW